MGGLVGHLVRMVKEPRGKAASGRHVHNVFDN